MTNREVLARKSNEELARWLNYICNKRCRVCVYERTSQECVNVKCCADGIQQWLEQEAKDDK